MNPMTSDAFHEEAFKVFQRYSLDNAWFKWAFESKEFDMQAPVSYVFAAWAGYTKAQEPSAGMLLLGDTKLRSTEVLVKNFGLSSAKGVQEEKDKAEVNKWMKWRAENAAGQVWEKDPVEGRGLVGVKGKPAVPIIGKGSILSTRAWSPMLNDSFIMSGAHGEKEFFWALSGVETDAFAASRSKGGTPKEMWLRFVLSSPGSIWAEDAKDGGTGWPRVLMRELIGLDLFGYKPEFSEHQLGFGVADKSKSDGATLLDYLVGVKNLGFHENNKAKLIKRIAKFLFDDDKALDALL
jgi:hypothetical protein